MDCMPSFAALVPLDWLCKLWACHVGLEAVVWAHMEPTAYFVITTELSLIFTMK